MDFAEFGGGAADESGTKFGRIGSVDACGLAWQDEISRIWQQFLAENIFQAA